MRMCPNCRLIAQDNPVCPECGWNLAVAGVTGTPFAGRYAEHLRYLTVFTLLMFGTALITALTMTRGNHFMPAVSGGLLAAGLIADIFLVVLVNRAAALLHETFAWTLGAVLTFPFGTPVFAWLLARRLGIGGKVISHTGTKP
jgi:hypothetical protein